MTAPNAPDPALPKIWFTRFMSETDSIQNLDFQIDYPPEIDAAILLKQQIEFIDASVGMRPIDQSRWSTFLFFNKGLKIRENTADAFRIHNGLMIVSPRLRDVMAQFDLGTSQLIEVPIYKSEKKKDPSRYPPHYVLHVTEKKSAFVPEASEHVKPIGPHADTPQHPDTLWKRDIRGEDVPALRATAVNGADMWGDPKYKRRIFFSDRLKCAIDEAKIKTQGLKFFPATDVPD
ncbi:imm11 family protein [Tropicibacter sp. Alg240-R139]|uniref:imm11 family protein n=1 Tax=Tropicibacter sp. Alg240-R139 TaxID=2305991 RepID=UPI0013E027FC|nr:DUF1629 domain-containing protein [Tropicibacter sp. Alg240-R139]